jgi:secondary thiamine-phosphate synthase enzyme
MLQATIELTVATGSRELTEITGAVAGWVAETGIRTGLLTLFIQHTSASLLIQENADPDVRRDLVRFMEHLAPESGDYIHATEGPDDMPAHIKAALTETSLSIPVVDGRPALGAWQGIYVFEHRAMPHDRHIVAHLMGEK